MIFRLQYCNDSGDTAIIDIETKTGVGVQEIEGSGNPFSLQYKTEKTDKSGRFMTSSADIEIYENEFFNIDILKTSNETDIKVSYYINEALEWQGFILPDFFSKEIKDNAVISMTATDRVSTLKSVTLDSLDEAVRLRDVAKLCLDKTGLILPLLTLADFINEEGSLIFNTYIQSQRLNDEKGRSISCYDTLESILILSNAQLVQRKGAWQIINKYQLEQGVGKNYSTISNFTNWAKTIHNFEFIGKGAIRTITPVASSVGVFQEYGGGKRYPDNYDFDEVGGWTAKNGFVYKRDNREIIEYNKIGENIVPTYGAATENYYLVNNNANDIIRPFDVIGEPYLESTKVNVPFSSSRVEINIDINAIAPKAIFIGLPLISSAAVNYAVVAESTTETLILNNSGQFVTLANGKDNFQRLNFDLGNDYEVLTKGDSIKGLLEVEGDVSDYKISVRIYGSGKILTTFVNFLSYTFKSEKEIAKGTLYKTTQGTNFTKEHDVETTVFGDYLTKGVNGYFYDYQNDDTSSLIAMGGAKTELWTAPSETESLPLLQQISRQKARQFSIAHDIVRGDIKMKIFDPLTIFKDCNNHEYVVVSATFDFLRSIASIEIEQILYDSNISRRDYIYSYFGEGESSIKSVGGISGGSGGGGGMTSSQLEILTNLADWWRLDEENDAIYSLKSVYSLKGISALGLGSGGGGTGGDFDRLDAWVDYNETKANWVLSALLGYDLHTRINSLEAGGGASNIEIAITGSGNAVTGVSKDGNTLTFDKGINFALSTHSHTIAQITGLQGALNLKVSQSDIDTAINGIEIGARNLLRNTNRKIENSLYPTVIFYLGTYKPIQGETVTIAFKGTLGTGKTQFGIFNSNDTTNMTYIAPSDKGADGVFRKTFQWNIGGSTNTSVLIYATPNSSAVSSVEDVMLVVGNKIAYYSPAPEDQVSDWNVTDVNSFAFLKNKPTQLSQFTDNIGVGTHIANTSNPHNVTKSQVGLGNVDNVKQATKSEFDTHTGNTTVHITAGERTNWNDANSKKHTHSNKALLDLITQSNIDVLAKLSIVDGNIKVDTTLWATGGISALGLGEGGGSGGGGADMLDSWANYTEAKANYYVPASLLVPFRNDTLSRLTSLESGSATSITTTGSGNAITSLTKSGSVITATKGLSFALSTHSHTIAQITGLQGALDLKATPADITTAIDGIEIGGRNLFQKTHLLTPVHSGLLGAPTMAGSTHPNGIYFAGGNNGRIGTIRFNGVIKGNGLYTLSFKFRGIQNTNVGLRVNICGNVSTEFISNNTNTFGNVVSFTANVTNYQAGVNDFIQFQYLNYVYYIIDDIQVEKGTIATDWTPAPEDQVSDWSETNVTSFSYIKNKPTTLAGYGIMDGVIGSPSALFIDRRTIIPTSTPVETMQFGFTSLNLNNTSPFADFIDFGGYRDVTGGSKNLLVFSKSANKTIRFYQGVFGSANYDSYVDVWHSGNLTPVTTDTTQTITGAKTFSTLLTASAGVNTPKVDFGNGFTIEPSGTELVFKYNGVIKQRMLSDGTILAVGGITALSTE